MLSQVNNIIQKIEA